MSLAVELDGRLGRGNDAVPLLREARRSVAAGTLEAALLDLAGARWAWLTGAWSAIRPLALEAAVSGRGDAAVRASSLALAAIGASALDDVGDARALRFAASEAVDEITGDARPEVLTALLWVARADIRVGSYDDAERHLHRAEHFGPDADLALPLLLADLELRRGRAQRGRAFADRALESARSRGDDGLTSWALAARCRADVAAGAFEDALAAGSELEQLLGDGVPQPPLGPGLVAFAAARLAAGHAALAGDRLVATLGGDALPWLEAHERAAGLRVLCEAALARGDGAGGEPSRGARRRDRGRPRVRRRLRRRSARPRPSPRPRAARRTLPRSRARGSSPRRRPGTRRSPAGCCCSPPRASPPPARAAPRRGCAIAP